MPSKYRIIFLIIFTIFFVSTSVIISIYSLGYKLGKDGLKNTINIRIETKPRGADVFNKGKKIGQTPGDFGTSDGKLLEVRLEKDGYMNENFKVWSQPNENSSARFDEIYLLPKENRKIEDLSGYKGLSFLSDDHLLLEKNGNLFVQIYTTGGSQGQKEEVKKESQIKVEKSEWRNIYDNHYWNKNQNLILYKDNTWKMHDINNLPFKIDSIVQASKGYLIILDTNKSLWTLNLNGTENIPKFIDSNYNGLSSTKYPSSIWIWKNNQIFKINRDKIDQDFEDYDMTVNIHLENEKLAKNSTIKFFEGDRFEIVPVHQGLMIKTANKLYYVPEFDKEQWEILSSKVARETVFKNTVYWLNEDKNLISYNLDTEDRDFFGKINLTGNFDDFYLDYYEDWKRILIYSKTEVYSVWNDILTLNDSVVNYEPNLWIQDSFCQTNVYEKSQFCFKDNDLYLYQNKSFF